MSMVEHDGTGTVVSRRAVEDVDKDAEGTPMSAQGKQTGGQEEHKEAPSDLTVAPTTITVPPPPTTTTTTIARRARFLENDGDERIDPRERANECKPVRKYATRYDLKLALPPTEPADALVMVLQKVWKQLKEADKQLVV